MSRPVQHRHGWQGRRRAGAVLAAATLIIGMASAPSRAAAAAPLTLPDMQIIVPTSAIAVGVVGGVRSLVYTHITVDLGAGPFEIDPTYNPTTHIATFVQSLYNMPSPGVWQFDHTVPVSATGVYEGDGDYNFPLNAFTLNAVKSDGTIGAQIAVSPKTKYCMTGDVFVGGVVNAPNQSFIFDGNCQDPTKPLGWSTGWGDQYDLTDPGQPIPLTGIPDGTYILRGTVDPRHVLTDSDPTNNSVDTKLTISGNAVTILSQTHPSSTVPTVSLTNPVGGTVVSGTIAVTAAAAAVAPATVASVQFTLDGRPLGAPVTQAPYMVSWDAGSAAPGAHSLGATVTDSSGRTAHAVAVAVSTPPPAGAFAIDHHASQSGKTSVAVANFSTFRPGEQLLALIGSDGAGGQTIKSVTGGGLTWSLVKRSNTQPGTAEVWKATAPSALSNITITSTASSAGFGQQLTVVALQGAAGLGASGAASAVSAASSVSYAATAAGSLGFAVGNDYDRAVGRSVGSDQTLLSQYLDPSQDTYWSQTTTHPSIAVGQPIVQNDSAPTGDRWNMVGVEVRSASAAPRVGPRPPPDTTPPSVALAGPTNGQTLSGTTTLTANAADSGGIRDVQFLIDGVATGNPVTLPPYTTSVNTIALSNASHVISARATDTSGNVATSVGVTVVVSNTVPPPPDTTAPSVTIISPTTGQGVRGTTSLSANASDDVAVAAVQFLVDGVPAGGPVTSPPYTTSVDTTPLSNGPHTISARARDTSGNVATSSVVAVTVSNRGTPPPDATPPTVAVTNPLPGMSLSGTVPVVAEAADNVAVAGVQFLLDGRPLGRPVTGSSYNLQWNTATATTGSHIISARTTDTSGNSTTSGGTIITVTNPPPPPPACFIMDVQVHAYGRSTVTTPAIHDGIAGETIIAMVSADGPSGAHTQKVTVSATGLSFTLVGRANGVSGDTEVYTATAAGILNATTVKVTAATSGYPLNVDVFAMQGTHGVGAVATASVRSGAPSVDLTTTGPTSLVYLVGAGDTGTSRGLPAGWLMQNQYLAPTGHRMWSQFTDQPTGAAGSVVRAHDTSPTNENANLVAFELVNDDV